MKKNVFAWIVALVASVAMADQAPEVRAPNGKSIMKKVDRETLKRIQMKQLGGFVHDTRNQKGSIVVVNAQSAAKEDWLTEVTKYFEGISRVSYEVKSGKFDLSKPVVQGSATLFVVDNPEIPMSLVAPESKWAMVNVAQLKTEKEAFFEARVKKALTRGMAYLMGAANSQYPMSLTGCITKPEDFDEFVAPRLPLDVVSKFSKYVEGYGITPYKISSYKNAVHEGWAAQPTNEFQKAIWDEIHALPTKPITIEPETK